MKQMIKNIALCSVLVFVGAMPLYAMNSSVQEKSDLDFCARLKAKALEKKGEERMNALDSLIERLQIHEQDLERRGSSRLGECTRLRIACQEALVEGVEDKMYQGAK